MRKCHKLLINQSLYAPLFLIIDESRKPKFDLFHTLSEVNKGSHFELST